MVLSSSIAIQKDFKISLGLDPIQKGLNSSLEFIFLVFHPTINTF